MTHFELTDETRTLADGKVLNRIRATQDLPHYGVTAGTLGGWVEHAHNLTGRAWVSGQAAVTGQARVTGQAWVIDQARVTGQAWVTGQANVTDWARVAGQAQVTGQAVVTGQARVYGQARVTGQAVVTGQAWVTGLAWVTGDALVTAPAEVVTVGPIGSEGCTATLHRTTDGHALHVGCWTGTLDALPAEVARRRPTWDAPQAMQEAWIAQYEALILLGRTTITTWDADGSEDS